MKQYLIDVIASFSQVFNALTWGDRDQTFSSRMWEGYIVNKLWCGIMVTVIDFIFFFEPDHCFKSYQSDSERTYQQKKD